MGLSTSDAPPPVIPNPPVAVIRELLPDASTITKRLLATLSANQKFWTASIYHSSELLVRARASAAVLSEILNADGPDTTLQKRSARAALGLCMDTFLTQQMSLLSRLGSLYPVKVLAEAKNHRFLKGEQPVTNGKQLLFDLLRTPLRPKAWLPLSSGPTARELSALHTIQRHRAIQIKPNQAPLAQALAAHLSNGSCLNIKLFHELTRSDLQGLERKIAANLSGVGTERNIDLFSRMHRLEKTLVEEPPLSHAELYPALALCALMCDRSGFVTIDGFYNEIAGTLRLPELLVTSLPTLLNAALVDFYEFLQKNEISSGYEILAHKIVEKLRALLDSDTRRQFELVDLARAVSLYFRATTSIKYNALAFEDFLTRYALAEWVSAEEKHSPLLINNDDKVAFENSGGSPLSHEDLTAKQICGITTSRSQALVCLTGNKAEAFVQQRLSYSGTPYSQFHLSRKVDQTRVGKAHVDFYEVKSVKQFRPTTSALEILHHLRESENYPEIYRTLSRVGLPDEMVARMLLDGLIDNIPALLAEWKR